MKLSCLFKNLIKIEKYFELIDDQNIPQILKADVTRLDKSCSIFE